jgi:hypothetical protein
VMNVSCLVKYFSDYAWAEYPVYSGYVQLTQNKKKLYKQGSSDFIQTVTDHSFDNVRRDIETIVSTTDSKGQTIQFEKKYPFHKASLLASITTAESQAIDTMVARNMISSPIEQIQRIAGVQQTLQKASYEFVNTTTVAPVNIKYQVKSNPIQTRVLFSKYDNAGNLVEQSKTEDVKKTYVWGYNNMYPVAEVTGASYTNVIAVLNNTILQNPNSDQALRNELQKIRQNFPAAQVTTYTYKPLVGMSSSTDFNNQSTYRSYDAFGRLILIRDKDNKVLKKLCYNYYNQQSNCVFYLSAAINGTYTKQTGCASGLTGGPYSVVLSEGEFISTVSQSDANTQAQQYAQQLANLYGACICDQNTCPGPNKKCINGICETGTLIVLGQSYNGTHCTTYYAYQFSDSSTMFSHSSQTSGPCN